MKGYMMQDRIKATDGMLYYIVNKIRPDLAKRIQKTNKLDTMIIGLGGQGTKHAGMMHDFGTTVVCGVAPGKGGMRIHEVIPAYNSVKEALEEHPDIVAASIWRHYVTAKDAAIETIEAGIPLIVLITEFIPLKDVRDILVQPGGVEILILIGLGGIFICVQGLSRTIEDLQLYAVRAVLFRAEYIRAVDIDGDGV